MNITNHYVLQRYFSHLVRPSWGSLTNALKGSIFLRNGSPLYKEWIWYCGNFIIIPNSGKIIVKLGLKLKKKSD
jgi:hypothetical protein